MMLTTAYSRNTMTGPLSRNKVDTSPTNLSSIITVWSPTSDSDPQVVLTGDAVGYRVLELFTKPTKTLNVFQVPHHGSARNSLPLRKNALPPPRDVALANQVLAFRMILAYTFDKTKWDSFVDKELSGVYIENFQKKYGVTLEKMMSTIVPAMKVALNNNAVIVLPLPYKNAKKSKAEYCYDQSVIVVNKISGPKAPGNVSINSLVPDFFDGLYTSTVTVASLTEQAKKFLNELAVKSNYLFDEITARQVAEFYSSVQAKLYYISADPKRHGHPHQTLLNGLIQANVNKKNKCTILLSSGAALQSQHLPDLTTWKEYVTFQYLAESGHATIDSTNGTVIGAVEYVPNTSDNQSRKRARDDLNSSPTAKHFRTVHVSRNGTYKVTTTLNNAKYYLSVKTHSEFELKKSEVAVAVELGSGDKNVLLSVTSKKHKATCYIDRLAIDADKYCFYRDEEEYLHRTTADVLTWSKKGASSDSTLLVFDFVSAQSGSITSSSIQSEFLRCLSTPRYTRGNIMKLQNVPTPKILPVQQYLQEMGVTTPPGEVVVKTLHC